MLKIKVKKINPKYKELYLTDTSYNASILNLVSLADKTKEERHSIAVKGAYASAKARKQKQVYRLSFMLYNAYEDYRELATELAEKYKDKEYLTIKDSNKLETKKKRYLMLKKQLKRANKEFKEKYTTNYLLN